MTVLGLTVALVLARTSFGAALQRQQQQQQPDAFSAPEPYAFMHGAHPTANPERPASPDPLVRYTWDSSVDSSALQQLAVTTAVAVHAEPADAFEGLDSLTGDGAVSVLFKAPGYIRLDYGLERPAWLEGISADLNATDQSHLLNASISEYDEPYDGKEEPVKMYGTTFRLETHHPSGDGQLYEGVRFAWLCFAVACPWSGGDAAPAATVNPPVVKPWRLTALRLVTKFQPLPYTGSFTSSDVRLERVWYEARSLSTHTCLLHSAVQHHTYSLVMMTIKALPV
eukprot:COSAG02_NODE_24_length_52386_cov_726.042898_22_plen_283_part_00